MIITPRGRAVMRSAMSFLLLALAATGAHAQQSLSKTQSTDTPRPGERLDYTLSFSCSGLLGPCGELTIQDDIPLDLIIEDCVVPNNFTLVQCPIGVASPTVPEDQRVIVTNDDYQDGTTFNIRIETRVRLDIAPGTMITNTGSTTITNPANTITATTSPPATVGAGTAQYTVNKTRTGPPASLDPAVDTNVSYRLQLCANTGVGNVNLTNVTFTDTFPLNATVIDADGGSISGNEITWNIDDNDIALSTLYPNPPYTGQQCVTRNIVLFYGSADFSETDEVDNLLVVDGTPDGGANQEIGNDMTDDEIGPPTPGASLSKSANDVLPNVTMDWGLTNITINNSNVPVLDLNIYDAIPQSPAGIIPINVRAGTWNSPDTPTGPSDVLADLAYSTDVVASAAECDTADYTGNSLGTDLPGAGAGSNMQFNLPAATTCVRWTFFDATSGNPVPRGWRMNNGSARIRLDTTGVAAPFPHAVQNCLFADFDADGDGGTAPRGSNGPTCRTANIETGTPDIDLDKNRVAPSGNVPPGTEIQFQFNFDHRNAQSTADTVNPIVSDLLPIQMEFVSWDAFTVPSGKEAPHLERIDDFEGTGRTLLRWRWDDIGTLPVGAVEFDGSPAVDANGETFAESGANPTITFTARVKDGTTPQTFLNESAFFDRSGQFTCQVTDNETGDGNDLNGDGDSDDSYCSANNSITVIEAAVLGGSKFVRGDQDSTRPNVDDPTSSPSVLDITCDGYPTGFTRFPCVAQTGAQGDFDYELRITNSGNVELNDYILYDVLPDVGDTGVGPATVGSDRDSTWRPVLSGAVTLSATTPFDPGTFTIEYSTDANPCRNELSDSNPFPAACTDNYGPLPADPTTVTAFRIIIPFADPNPFPPAQTVVFEVPMAAPVGAPQSVAGDASRFNPAWNTFAHRVTERLTTARLPAAEPRKVGIIVPATYRVGNLVWLDLNQNGIAESGEPGIDDVNVQLYVDDDGTAGISAGDTLVDTQTTAAGGKYAFESLDEGDYYLIIPDGQDNIGGPLEELFRSTRGQEANPNDDADNNQNGVTIADGLSSPAAGLASGIVTLGPLASEPTTEQLRSNDATDDDNDGVFDDYSNFSVDFGYWRPFSLGNRVWLDDGIGGGNANNGLIDGSEAGIDNVVVNLLDGAGQPYDSDPDTAGVQQPTTTTADGGYYRFDLLPEGDYIVEIIPPAGLTSSTGLNGSPTGPFEGTAPDADGDITDSDDNGDRSGAVIRSLPVTLGTGGTPDEPTGEPDLVAGANPQGARPDGAALPDPQGNMTVDFGLFEAYSLGNRVWLDNGAGGGSADDGTIDGGEAGIDGVTVTLFEDANDDGAPDGPAVATDTTSNDGYYRFDGLAAGTYVVVVDTPTGFASSNPNAGDPDTDVDENDDNGSNVVGSTVRSAPVTLGPGTSEPTADNEDGPGDPGASDDRSNMTVDFGFIDLADRVSIGSTVFADPNDSGVQDPGELGISGITVELRQAGIDGLVGTADDVLINTTVTDGAGDYLFTGLAPGQYYVKIPTPPAVAPLSSTGSTDLDNRVDRDDNGAQPDGSGGMVTSPLIDLQVGAEPTGATESGQGGMQDDDVDANGDMTIDFGFIPNVDLVSIGSTVFLDPDDSGTQTTGENGIPNVTVELYRPGGDGIVGGGDDVLIASVDTDANGDYLFAGLPAGDYYVKVPTPPDSAPLSSTADGTLDNQVDGDDNGAQPMGNGGMVFSPVITLAGGTEPTGASESGQGGDQDDGEDANGDMTIDFGFVPAVYDLALTKVLATGQASAVSSGDLVRFTITVFNQGNGAASQISVVDYIPTGLELADAGWTAASATTATRSLPGTLDPGANTTVDITLRVTASAAAGSAVNFAEIASFRDGDGNSVADVDSTPDSNDGNDAGGQPNSPADDATGGNGTGTVGDTDAAGDEDDHDPAVINIDVFDLSLTKALAVGQPAVTAVGETIAFTITVSNEGTITATNIVLTEYIPAGLQLADSEWTDNGDGTASTTLAGPLDPGNTLEFDVMFEVTEAAQGVTVINRAEITDAQDSGGGPVIDIDSTPDSDDDNDPVGEDDVGAANIVVPNPNVVNVPVNSPWAVLLMVLLTAAFAFSPQSRIKRSTQR